MQKSILIQNLLAYKNFINYLLISKSKQTAADVLKINPHFFVPNIVVYGHNKKKHRV